MNLGGALIIWDRLFGTYEAQTAPMVYGVEPMPARPRNPFYLELYLWGGIFRDLFVSLRNRRSTVVAQRA